MKLWLSDARGQYIPQAFAKSFDDRAKRVTGVSAEDWAILDAGPEHESYWDAWAQVEQDARITDVDGTVFTIWQDGDCWLVPQGMQWDDDKETYVWPDEEEGQ
jgi:sarcosine oxidase gamma subunit